MNKGQLYIVATPIGNLADLSSRAVQTLRKSDLICAEDTRVTGGLLSKCEIKTKMTTVQQHSDESVLNEVIDQLKEGRIVSLVTDAGTPNISDPGGQLVARAVAEGIDIVPIPGPSALIAALSISGFAADNFTFLGFPPHKKGRETYFRELALVEHTIVLYEATHRIEKTLAQLPPDRLLVVCRELTKLYETTYRGTAATVIALLAKGSKKGEFVIVVAPKNWK
jgi:16S rRNA (cytidine1402-2'-O)-methyltransferase